MIDILEIFVEAAQLGRETFPKSEWSRCGGGSVWDRTKLEKRVYRVRRNEKRKRLEREARAARKAELLALGWSS